MPSSLDQGTRVRKSSHPGKTRMLVLETDDANTETKERMGSFGDVLDQLFKEAGEKHDPPLGIETVIKYVVEDEGGQVPTLAEIDELDVHAILLTGSKYDAHGDNEWILKLLDLMREIWKTRPHIRFSGICFGHQLLCRLHGSRITSTPGNKWELSHTTIELTPLGRRLFNLSKNKDKDRNGNEGGNEGEDKHTIHLHQMHVDHVDNAPSAQTSDLLKEDEEVHVWGRTDLTPIQGCYIPRRMFTSQGHLGFDEGMVKAQVRQRVEMGQLGHEEEDEQVGEAVDKAEWEHDGVEVAAAVLRFFHGDDDAFA